MPLLSLPNELLSQIADELWLPDLESFAFSSKKCFITCSNRLKDHKQLQYRYQIVALEQDGTQWQNILNEIDLAGVYCYVEALSVKWILWRLEPGEIDDIDAMIHKLRDGPALPSDLSQLSSGQIQDLLFAQTTKEKTFAVLSLFSVLLLFLIKSDNLHMLSLTVSGDSSYWLRQLFGVIHRTNSDILMRLKRINLGGVVCIWDFASFLALQSLSVVRFEDKVEVEHEGEWPDNVLKTKLSVIDFTVNSLALPQIIRLAEAVTGPCCIRAGGGIHFLQEDEHYQKCIEVCHIPFAGAQEKDFIFRKDLPAEFERMLKDTEGPVR